MSCKHLEFKREDATDGTDENSERKDVSELFDVSRYSLRATFSIYPFRKVFKCGCAMLRFQMNRARVRARDRIVDTASIPRGKLFREID